MKYLRLFILLFLFIGSESYSQNFQWGKTISSISYDYVMGGAVDQQKNFYLCGSYNPNTDFDPGSGVVNIPASPGATYFAKYDSSGTLVWAKGLISTQGAIIFDLFVDTAGNIYLTGHFNGKVDMDPGSGVFDVTTADSAGTMIGKYGSSGNLIWAGAFGGNSAYGGTNIEGTPGGDIIVSGGFSISADFDLGSGVHTINAFNTSNADAFVACYTSAGNFVWANALRGPSWERVQSSTVDPAGNVYVIGEFVDSLEIVPGPTPIYLKDSATMHSLCFLVKYDAAGNFLWAKRFSGNDLVPFWFRIKTDAASNLYIGGSFLGSADLDAGPGTNIISSEYPNGSVADYTQFLAKYTSAGNSVWAKELHGESQDLLSSLQIDNQGNIYIAGSTYSSFDFDPGIGISDPHMSSAEMSYFAKYDTTGRLYWTKSLYHQNTTSGFNPVMEVEPLSGDIFLSATFTNTIDLDPGSGTSTASSAGFMDIYLSRFSPDVCSNGILEIVSQSDRTCSTSGNAVAQLSNAILPHNFVWNSSPTITDDTLITNVPGTYLVNATDGNGCIYSREVLIEGPDTASTFDLQTGLVMNVYNGPVGTNLISTFELDAFNNTCYPVSGTLTFVLDPLLTYSGSTITPSSISGDTLRWNFSALDYYSGHLSPVVTTNNTFTIELFQQVKLKLYVDPYSGDSDTTNNIIIDSAMFITFFPVGVSKADASTAPLVFPNPSHDKITIQASASTKVMKAVIYDISGRRIMSMEEKDTSILSMTLQDLSSGPYLLIIDTDGVISHFKIIKD